MRLAGFQFLCCALLCGCRTSVAGHYGLDLEATTLAVDKVAAETPADASMKAQAIKMLEATKLDVELTEAGKMTSTTVLSMAEQSSKNRVEGSWKLDGKRVVIKVEEQRDTVCDVDGRRLFCSKAEEKLFGHYVLVKK